MLCLALLLVKPGQMHEKFIALDREPPIIQGIFLTGRECMIDPGLKICSFFGMDEEKGGLAADLVDVVCQCAAKGNKSGLPAFRDVLVTMRRVRGDQNAFARMQQEVLAG